MVDLICGSQFECDNRALQAALELSMVNLSSSGLAAIDQQQQQQQQQQPYGIFAGFEGHSKSLNITQCVSVPSSEHVAEIVGKQGCKIKALRAKTNTYIKTPVRGEPPIFSISGRPDHVNSAKYEIIAAAEHFSQIRAARPTPNVGPGTDKVTIYVKVPYRVVGLVVGPRGSTVKRIQLMTRTFIVTPSRDKEPYFEVKGTPENVERARKEIESYIQMRTGSKCDDDDSDSVSGISSPDSLVEQMQQKCKIADTTATGAQYPLGAGTSSYLGLPPDCSQWSPPVSNMSFSGMQFTPPDNSYQPMSAPLLTADKASFDFGGGNVGKPQPLSPTGSYESTSSDGLGANSPKQQSPLVVKKTVSSCWNCRASDEMAALIPCGHNMFCQTCAHYITCSSGCCPICGAQVTNVMYI